MGMKSRRESPDFLAIGYVTVDITPTPAHPEGERRYGGAAAYAALTAVAMGLRAAVLTSASRDFPFADVMPGIDVVNVESPNTTTFQNRYEAGNRNQLLAARGGNITYSDIPEAWRAPPIVVICPLARELPADAYSWFPGSATSTGLVLQGFFRQWDDYGVVSVQSELPPHDKPETASSRVALAVASHNEISAQEALVWSEVVDVVARTKGPGGAELYSAGEVNDITTPTVNEIDPTGAGDVWAAAYLIRLRETGDIYVAARFASAAASLSVMGAGLTGIPNRKDVQETVALEW